MKDNSTLPFRFKWVSCSPDPHNKTMRNNLEPQDLFVEVSIPLKAEYFANTEPIIQFQLGTDTKIKEMPQPILTPEGMKYALQQLSLQEVAEPVSDDEWEDEGDDSDWDEDTEEESDDDDDNWDDDEDLDWDDE